MKVIKPLSQTELNALLDYKPSTGALYWKRREGDDRGTRIFNSRFAGKRAGSLNNKKYWCIAIKGQQHLVSRVVWTMVHGPTDKLIDHKKPITGAISDNRITNLREASYSQNRMNSTVTKITKSGLKGVSKIGERYKANINYGGSTRHLGIYDTAAEAHAAYAGAARMIYGEFARAA